MPRPTERPASRPDKRDGASRAPGVRLRGIYATALTAVLADLGYPIADPSEPVADRLAGVETSEEARVHVADRADRQGVRLVGPPGDVAGVATALDRAVPGTVRVPDPHGPTLVFTRAAKTHLDERRRAVSPTLADHHLLKVHRVPGVDELEAASSGSSAKLRAAGERLWESAVAGALRPGAPVTITHAKPWRRDVTARAIVERFADGLLTVGRRFRGGGRYDSLNVPKCEGDWGRIEIPADGTVLRRTYYRASGVLLGELYNVQTPAEIGPAEVWYVDLEVDVVRFADGSVAVVDLDELDRLARSGAVEPAAVEGARRLASDLAAVLRRGGNWLDVARRPLA